MVSMVSEQDSHHQDSRPWSLHVVFIRFLNFHLTAQWPLVFWSHALPESSDVIALGPLNDSHHAEFPTPLHRVETRLNNLVSRE